MYFLQKLKRELITFFSRTCVRAARNDYLGLDLRYPIIYGMGRGYVIPKELTMGYLLEAFVKSKKGMVIDIGANVGVYLVKLRVIDSEREYVGLEPNPVCVHYVNELIRLNRFKNCRILPVALGRRLDLVTLNARKLGDKTASITANSDEADGLGTFAHSAITMAGDEVIHHLAPREISVIKIDVEGGELEVLLGLQETLKQYRPYLYVEIWAEIGEKQIGDLLALIESLDYGVYGLVGKDRLLTVSDASDIQVQFDPNYILVPHEDRKRFLSALDSTPIEFV